MVSRREWTDDELERRARSMALHHRRRMRVLLDDLHRARQAIIERTHHHAADEAPFENLVWPEYTEAADDLYVLLSRAGLVVPFDWRGWAHAVGFRHEHPPHHFGVADAVRNVTTIIRRDHSGDGSYATAIINGSLLHAVEVIVAAD
ncbi:MAG: DUF6508 domain-containing protein [Acidimicrobiales bacterium]